MSKYLRIFILFLILISTGGIYFQFFSTIINTSLISLSFLLFILTKNKKYYFHKYFFKLLLIFIILVFHNIINYNTTNLKSYLTLYTTIIAISILIYHYNIISVNILSDLIKILKLIIVHSVINFILSYILFSSFTLWKASNTKFEVYTLYHIFFFYDKEIGSLLIRNCGLFWEPGILQIFINMYVFFRLFVFKDIKNSTLIFYFTVLLTTFSTTGLLVFSTITFIYYYNKINKLNSIIAIALLIIISSTFILDNFERKIIGDSKISYQARLYDAISGTLLISENPFSGFGYNSNEAIISQNKYEYYSEALKYSGLTSISERGNTNSIIMNFVYWGIPIGSLILFLLFKQSIIQEKKILFLLINILFCASEPLFFSGFFLIIILSGYFKFNIKQTNTIYV